MNIAKDKETGTYRVEIWTPHGRRKISTKQTSLSAAKKAAEDAGLAQIEAAARTGQLTGAAISRVLAGKKMALRDVMGKWVEYQNNIGRSPRTVGNYLLYLEPFIKEHELSAPAAITLKHVDQFINRPNDEVDGEHMATRKIRLTAIRDFFKFCAANNWCVGNPASIVRVKGNMFTHSQKEIKKRVPFTDKEVGKLLAQLPPGDPWHTMIAVGRYSGLRLGDAACLEWDSLSEPGYLVCHTDKRDRRVRVPIEDAELERALSSLMPPANARKARYIFPDMAEIHNSPTRRALLSVQFKRLCEMASVDGKSFHCLRHAYATEQVKKGRPLWYVADSMGHQSEETTKGYVH
jgi:integrase